MPTTRARPRSTTQIVVVLLMSLRGIAAAALGVGLVLLAAGDDSGWGSLFAFLGVCVLALGAVSLAQAVMVWSGRPRLMAMAALVEAASLVLWLWAHSEERGSSRPLVRLLILGSIVGLCSLAASMWRRGRMPTCGS